ncbi:hypothetical protein H310_14209 [Aphanomyces invadans]|uniref:Uncharacterized protein n=1 Tax=Aphanomyces invadans TaxID=157072 RepID=A0A024TCN5_9STRA|nr:hypothetical protein H310_14209 [Aphanomyces invadans]ETV91112.1 hypothetical protein H310_14209 [Aphanomyces invadans]|eukprot:XP_008880239.1 hypothetical protein H310_14209 [Aphanomyces invadans]
MRQHAPRMRHCDLLVDCTSCAVADSCAWCASKSLCLTVEDTYTAACRGTVFDPPCPATFVADNQVVGNLAVVADPVFGGGSLSVEGTRPLDKNSYRTSVDATGVSVDSAGSIDLKAGDATTMNVYGHSVNIEAGSGTSLNRGRGGSVLLAAGVGHGVERQGGSGVGGDVTVSGGESKEATGGNVKLIGGSSTLIGGAILISSGGSSTGSSGPVTMSTGPAPLHSGPVVLKTGTSSSSGPVFISTGDASIAGAIAMQPGESSAIGSVGSKITLAGGSSTSATGGTIKLTSGESARTTSGDISVLSSSAPIQSGNVLLGTGTAAKGVSGSVYVATGATSDDSKKAAGDIVLVIGEDSGALQSGSVIATGGPTKGGAAGGIQLSGGDIMAESVDTTSRGGVVDIRGGSSKTCEPTSRGGNVRIEGGSALAGAGGGIAFTSGRSEASNSGDVRINTAVAQTDSGVVSISSGASTFSQSGDVTLTTGDALQGKAGFVKIQTGLSQGGAASDITLNSGASTSLTGGNIVLETGKSGTAASGDIKIGSANSAASGALTFSSGNAQDGSSGSIRLSTGDSVSGTVGNIEVAAGTGKQSIVSIKVLGGTTNAANSQGGNVSNELVDRLQLLNVQQTQTDDDDPSALPPPLQIQYQEPLPLADFFAAIDEHFGCRKESEELQAELNDRAHQFRVIQKRLLVRYKDRNPSPLNSLDMLLHGTYSQILDLSRQVDQVQRKLSVSGNRLACSVHLLLMLMRYKFDLDDDNFAVLQSHLSPRVADAWEESTEAAITDLLKTSLAMKKEPAAATVGVPVELVLPEDTKKLKKHITIMCDRLSKGGRLVGGGTFLSAAADGKSSEANEDGGNEDKDRGATP